MAQLDVYRHSGRLGSGTLAVPLVGVIAAFVLGVAYSYADVYSPVAGYISILLVLFFALGLGYAIAQGAILSKCRNTKYVGIVGLVAAVLALYVAWVTFIFALMQRSSEQALEFGLIDMFIQPKLIWTFVKIVNESGWYSIRGGTPSGTILWIFWIIEAAIIVIITPLVACMCLSGRVFCENSNRWCERVKNYFRLGVTDNEACLQRILEGDFKALAELPAVDVSDAPAVQIDLHRTREPGGTRAIQLKSVKLVQGKKDEVKEDTDDLTPICLLSQEQYECIESLADRTPEAKPPAEDQTE